MLRCQELHLSSRAKRSLKLLQGQVEDLNSREQQYQHARQLFRRKAPKRTFDEVRLLLAQMAPPCESCFYCERDRYRDIDHFMPLRHFPGEAFSWENYVFSCVICNQSKKSDCFAVFAQGNEYLALSRSTPFDFALPSDDHVPINPRKEDPLDFLMLDLESGIFIFIGDQRTKIRAEYTCDLLGLNCDGLARTRRQVYRNYRLVLREYIDIRESGDTICSDRMLKEILEMPQPTVLVEMRRQSSDIEELGHIFSRLPSEVGARPR
jgi:hypothetical protein